MDDFSGIESLTGLPGGPDKAGDVHRGLALRAFEHQSWSWRTCFNHDSQYQLDQRQQPFGITVQEAIIPDPAKASGQNVLQHQPQEVFALEGTVQGLARLAFEIAECHLAIAIGNDVVFTDHAAV